MNTDLSMQGQMSQIHTTLREKEQARIAEHRRHILYLVRQYLDENGYHDSRDALVREAQLSPNVEVCDNISLEIIIADYESYYRMRFYKNPTLCKKIAANVNATENKVKSNCKQASKSKNSDSALQRTTNQTENVETNNDINLSVKVTPIFVEKNDGDAPPVNFYAQQKNRQAEISKCIQKLYPAESEYRKIAEDIAKEIILHNLNVHWDDVIGLDDCKSAIRTAVVYPIKFPIFFSGKFSHWKGILLYGAPGTGKTMLAKAAATECDCTFFNITASSLVSKWRGDSEKYVRVLFDLAYSQSPTIIFIDEIDWIATQTNDSLSEPAKRFRSELLARMDGLISPENANVVLLAATNAPWSIDAALLRRLEKQIHVPLPDDSNRLQIFQLYVSPSVLNVIRQRDYIIKKSENYSGADIKLVCKEAWIIQTTPNWLQLEKNEILINSLQYEVNDFAILSKVVANVLPTCVDDNYISWQKPNRKQNTILFS